MGSFTCKLLQAHNSTATSSSSSSSYSYLSVSTKSIIAYSKVGDLASARKMFDEMPQRSVISWTAMISAYSRNCCSQEALTLYATMVRSGFLPNQFTYGATLRACTQMGGDGATAVGMQIHGCIEKSRFSRDMFVQSAVLDLYLKCGASVDDAQALFERMERRDVVCWNSLIGGYTVRGLGGNAFGLFCSMIRDGTQLLFT